MSNNSYLFQNLIDFEYNQYLLMSLIQKAETDFKEGKLFPTYIQLLNEYKNIKELELQFDQMHIDFPKEIEKLNIQQQKIYYSSIPILTNPIKDIFEVIRMAIPALEIILEKGKELHDNIKNQMHFKSVGIEPLFNKEGLLLIYDMLKDTHHVFTYSMYVIENLDDRTVQFKTEFITSYSGKNIKTSEDIKYDFIQKNKKTFPLPATFLVECEAQAPVFETSLPIAREFVFEYIFQTV